MFYGRLEGNVWRIISVENLICHKGLMKKNIVHMSQFGLCLYREYVWQKEFDEFTYDIWKERKVCFTLRTQEERWKIEGKSGSTY